MSYRWLVVQKIYIAWFVVYSCVALEVLPLVHNLFRIDNFLVVFCVTAMFFVWDD